MKKFILSFTALVSFAAASQAQGWFRQPTPNDTLRRHLFCCQA